MEWLDKIKDTASKTAQIAKEKSSEIYEITKISFTINEYETKIDKLFKNTGMLIYRDYENGVELSEDIQMIMQEIDEKFAEIAVLKDEINKIKNVSICPSCQKTNPNDANYCLSCGEKLK